MLHIRKYLNILYEYTKLFRVILKFQIYFYLNKVDIIRIEHVNIYIVIKVIFPTMKQVVKLQ